MELLDPIFLDDLDMGSIGLPDGNTSLGSPAGDKPKRGQKKRVTPSIYWCFTYNNYVSDKVALLEQKLDSLCEKYVYGKEVGESGTPHLQGWLKAKKRLRPLESIPIKEIHWEKSCKKNEEAAIRYCCKEDPNPIANFDTRRYKPPRPIIDPLEGKELFWWQREILDLAETDPDSRTVYWYWDEVGGAGKTSLCKHLCIKRYDAIPVDGSAKDVMYGIVKRQEAGIETNIVLFNFVRSKEEFVSYEAIEKIKDGLFFSTKYESSAYVANSPHVICFANFRPKEDKLSLDRWVIKNINNN